MLKEKQDSNKEPFISSELRPLVGPDLWKYPPLKPGISREEMQKRVDEVMKDLEISARKR